MKLFLKIIPLVLIFCLFFGCTPVENETVTEETTSIEYNTDVNGDWVPAFSEVRESSLDPNLFKWDENGRVYYDYTPCESYTGIDVSVFQGDIDWNAVKADGIDFAMIRVGCRGYGPSGLLMEDSKFAENVKGATAAGLEVGVYFFSQAINAEEAEEEAKFVIGIIKDFDITFPVAYDWEIIDYDTARTDDMTGEQITECANAFCDEITAAGLEAIIYFNCEVGYFNYNLNKLTNKNFWIAEYGDIPTFYYDYKMWQYTKTGQVDGIDGDVDLNICLKNIYAGGAVG